MEKKRPDPLEVGDTLKRLIRAGSKVGKRGIFGWDSREGLFLAFFRGLRRMCGIFGEVSIKVKLNFMRVYGGEIWRFSWGIYKWAHPPFHWVNPKNLLKPPMKTHPTKQKNPKNPYKFCMELSLLIWKSPPLDGLHYSLPKLKVRPTHPALLMTATTTVSQSLAISLSPLFPSAEKSSGDSIFFSFSLVRKKRKFQGKKHPLFTYP